jgi:hypothetical protein
MTNDDDRRDELASALLDGDLGDKEAAAARRDPAVAARVAELAAARDLLRDVPPAPAAAREAGLAAALAAYDDPGQPTRLASRRERRRAPVWLGAAATVAIVAGVVGVLAVAGGLGGSSSSDSGEASTAEGAPESPVPEASAESGAGDAGAAVVVDLGDLGDFPTEDALAARVAGSVDDLGATRDASGEVPGAASSPTTTVPGPLASERPSADDEALSGAPGARVALPGAEATCTGDDLPEAPVGGQAGVLAHAAARLAGTHVDVWLVRTASGTRLVALDSSCRARVDQTVD